MAGLGGLRTASEETRSISDSQKILPLPEIALEAEGLRNPKTRDDTPLDLLA